MLRKKKKKQGRLYSPLGFSGELGCGESWGSAVARTWKMWEDETKMPRKDEKEDEEKAEKEWGERLHHQEEELPVSWIKKHHRRGRVVIVTGKGHLL